MQFRNIQVSKFGEPKRIRRLPEVSGIDKQKRPYKRKKRQKISHV